MSARPNHERAKREKWGFALAGVAMWGVGLFLLWQAAREYLLVKASVPTECTIVSSTVAHHSSEDSRDGYSAEVILSYEAEGRRYQITDEGPQYHNAVDGRVKAEMQVRGLPAGMVVPCFRVAGLPSLATMFARDLWSSSFAGNLYFGIGMLLIPVIIELVGRRQRRKRSRV